jgi:hypothetical protein
VGSVLAHHGSNVDPEGDGWRLHVPQVCPAAPQHLTGLQQSPHLGLCCCLCPELSLLGLVLTLLGHLLLPREVNHLQYEHIDITLDTI